MNIKHDIIIVKSKISKPSISSVQFLWKKKKIRLSHFTLFSHSFCVEHYFLNGRSFSLSTVFRYLRIYLLQHASKQWAWVCRLVSKCRAARGIMVLPDTWETVSMPNGTQSTRSYVRKILYVSGALRKYRERDLMKCKTRLRIYLRTFYPWILISDVIKTK